MGQLSPMMQHYLETKKQNPDCILFYRLGDFYEMFFEDAQIISKELELTLTGKSCGLEERAPMCGIPYHALDGYLSKLVEKGYRVAICDQVEDPKLSKGMVKREITRIVTPGTHTSGQNLEDAKNLFLMGIVWIDHSFGVATVDVSTGDFFVTEVEQPRNVMDEIVKFGPVEIVCNSAVMMSGLDLEDLKGRLGISVLAVDDWYYETDHCRRLLMKHFATNSLMGLGLADITVGVNAAGAVLQYLYDTQKVSLAHITGLSVYSTGKYMVLDGASRRNLELCETLREKQKRGSLLWVLDKTKTAMGARLLRLYLEQPLLKKQDILARQEAIAELNANLIAREELREYLSAIYDLERLVCRVTYQNANPRDMIAFQSSIAMIPGMKTILQDFSSALLREEEACLDSLTDLSELIKDAVDPEPPITIKEGGIIRTGYSEEVDRLRLAKTDGKQWLADLEAREREATGIKNLKIKYNRVFGYYFEVTNSFQHLVPESWIRKQTTVNSERYTTPELKELEDTILGAEEKLYNLEYELFVEVRERVAANVNRIQKTAKAVAVVDVLASLAFVAERNRYVRPEISEDGAIYIRDGRHPVVEKMIPDDLFVANDTVLNQEEARVSIITGPNMAGKSTYMRQTALIVLMAQIGSFVPASEAKIGLVDRIFTRVGASDDLASGQSTFMVEMNEVANILRNATRKSLLILDEIGRGTSTFDGLAIAWSVIEHVVNPQLIGAKTLFATHYHELTELEGTLPGVKNYCIAVKEQGEDIVFLRKIIRGGADKSYGIQVAKLAGVPESVLVRAREIVARLMGQDLVQKARALANEQAGAPVAEMARQEKKESRRSSREEWDNMEGQLSLFDHAEEHPVLTKLRNADLMNMTPMEAMNLLFALQKEM